MDIAVLGGTFDPIHLGHLVIAEEAAVRLGLEQVLFVPAGKPRLKPRQSVTPTPHRLEMTRLAISDNLRFRLSDIEIKRSGPSYTVDTVRQLQDTLGKGARFYFILGWDSLEGFHLWKEAGTLVQMCRLVAVPRVGYQRPDLKSLAEKVPGVSEAVIFLDAPLIDISSSQIRERVAKGLPIRYVVPPSVERYIIEQGLYRGEAG